MEVKWNEGVMKMWILSYGLFSSLINVSQLTQWDIFFILETRIITNKYVKPKKTIQSNKYAAFSQTIWKICASPSLLFLVASKWL